MGSGRDCFGPKILATLDLYRRHPEAVIAELLPAGIRWSDIGETFLWDEAIAVLTCAPPWGPLSQALNPKDWVWGIPGFDQVVLISELLATGNVQRGNQSGARRSDFPERTRRPYDEREIVDQKTVGKPVDVVDAAAVMFDYTGLDFSTVLLEQE